MGSITAGKARPHGIDKFARLGGRDDEAAVGPAQDDRASGIAHVRPEISQLLAAKATGIGAEPVVAPELPGTAQGFAVGLDDDESGEREAYGKPRSRDHDIVAQEAITANQRAIPDGPDEHGGDEQARPHRPGRVALYQRHGDDGVRYDDRGQGQPGHEPHAPGPRSGSEFAIGQIVGTGHGATFSQRRLIMAWAKVGPL